MTYQEAVDGLRSAVQIAAVTGLTLHNAFRHTGLFDDCGYGPCVLVREFSKYWTARLEAEAQQPPSPAPVAASEPPRTDPR